MDGSGNTCDHKGRHVKVGGLREGLEDPITSVPLVVNIWLPCGLLNLDPVYSLPPPVCFLQCI